MSIRKLLSAIGIIFLLIPYTVFSADVDLGKMKPQDEVDHFQAQGCMNILENRLQHAQKAFEHAGNVALQNAIWDGCIDAAIGLIMLNKIQKAHDLLKQTEHLIKDSGDMRANIAMVYAILSLPEKNRTILRADRFLEDAYALANVSQNAYGLLETSKAFRENIDQKKSYALLIQAKQIATIRKNSDLLNILAYQFILHGDSDMSSACKREIKRIRSSRKNTDNRIDNSDNPSAYSPKIPLKKLQHLDEEQKRWLYAYKYFYTRQSPVSALGYSPHLRRLWCTNRLTFYSLIHGRYIKEH